MLLLNQAPWFLVGLAMVLGAVLGSFLNCAADRLPHGRSLRHPPSMCDTCHTRLTLPDLVPILSWLALRGRCRHCGAPVPARNTWLELVTTLWPLLAWWVLGAGPAWLGVTAAGWLAGGAALLWHARRR